MPIPYDYQIVDDTPKQDSALTDLAIMGVPAEYQNRFPLPDSYPRKFSEDGQDVWIEMLLSDEYAAKVRNQTLDGAWHNAILLFLDLCQEQGVVPFANNTDVSRNEAMLYAMRSQRLRLVRFMNDFGIFTSERAVQVRRAYREYVRTPTGMIVSSWADMFPYSNDDRTSYEKWLTDPAHGRDRFLRYVDNHFVHQIVPGLQVWVKCINMRRIQVGFTIDLKGTINIPGNKTPTRKEVDAFLDRLFWFPLIRQHRFDGVVTRLF